MRGAGRSILLVGLVAMLAGRAAADSDPEVAKRLFDEGRAFYDQNKYIEACVLFERSYQLDPAVGTKLNLAECAERDNKPRAAWLLWISAAAEFERSTDAKVRKRAAFARERADQLAPKLATVVVQVAKPDQKGLTIQIAGREVAPAEEIIDRLEPGAIIVTARAPGREPFDTTVTVALGGRVTIEVPKLAKLGGKDKDEPETSPSQRNPWWAAAVGGGVVTALGVGLIFVSNSKINDAEAANAALDSMDPSNIDEIMANNAEGETWETRSKIGGAIVLGGAVLTTVFVIKAMRTGRQRPASAAVTPVVAPKFAGAQLSLSW